MEILEKLLCFGGAKLLEAAYGGYAVCTAVFPSQISGAYFKLVGNAFHGKKRRAIGLLHYLVCFFDLFGQSLIFDLGVYFVQLGEDLV